MTTMRRRSSVCLLFLGALMLAACGAGPVSYPTGAGEILVQLSATGGGLLPGRLYYLEEQFPSFTLFGDGRLVYTSEGGFYQAHLDDAAIRRLLELAVNDVRFFDLPDSVGPTCCDMPTSRLTITANGQTRSVGMSLLEENRDAGSPERRLLRLLEVLDALRTGKDAVYTPAGATLHVELARDEPASATPAWPLAQVSLAAALEQKDGVSLTGADARAALEAASHVAAFVENGITYLVVAVPNPP